MSSWLIKKSEHFIFKYPQNTFIADDIDLIIQKRELAYNEISSFLEVEAEKPLTLYLSPSREFCIAKQMIPGTAIPHKFFASLIYNDHPLCFEKLNYGHEIAHLLVYFWDKKKYHLEFLEEGLATVLDMSVRNYHLNYLDKLQTHLTQRKTVDFSLKVSPFLNETDYEKAASFIKFLIDCYGLKKFKKLFLLTAMDRKGTIYYNGNKKLDKNYLKRNIRKVYQKKSDDIQKEWLENLGIFL